MAFTLLHSKELRFSANDNSDFFGQEPHMPCLYVGWASVQKAGASGGFSLAFSRQPSLAEVPGSPPVSGMVELHNSGALLTHELASKGSRSAGAMLWFFLPV